MTAATSKMIDSGRKDDSGHGQDDLAATGETTTTNGAMVVAI